MLEALDEELSTATSCSMTNGRLRPELAALAPTGDRRMGANPQANGGRLLRDLRLPDYRDYAIAVPRPAPSTPRRPACRATSSATS